MPASAASYSSSKKMDGYKRPSTWRLACGYSKVTHRAKSSLPPHQLPVRYTGGSIVSFCQNRWSRAMCEVSQNPHTAHVQTKTKVPWMLGSLDLTSSPTGNWGPESSVNILTHVTCKQRMSQKQPVSLAMVLTGCFNPLVNFVLIRTPVSHNLEGLRSPSRNKRGTHGDRSRRAGTKYAQNASLGSVSLVYPNQAHLTRH